MISTVSTTAQLTATLKAAHAGDTIKLAAGSYSGVSIKALDFGAGITITSADATKPAEIVGLTVMDVTGLTFRGLDFVAKFESGSHPLYISESANITFDDVHVHGSMDGNPTNDTGGLYFARSAGITVTNSEFEQLHWGVAHLGIENLKVSNNDFHDIRMDGVRGGGSNFVTIADNSFTNFHIVEGDHADAIQFWTSNTTSSAHDITVTGNVFTRGEGDRLQGVFIRDEVGGLPFQHVTIANNLISGGAYQGISVDHGEDITVVDNIVQGFADYKSWIRLEYVDGARVVDNQTNLVSVMGTVTHAVVSGNTIVAQATDDGAWAMKTWLSQNGEIALSGQNLMGTVGVDTLTGSSLADTLNGVSGLDVLTGGGGDDVYITGDRAKIVELANGGSDTLRTSITFTLPGNIENLTLTGSGAVAGYGNSLANDILGNSAANKLMGRFGADTLSGAGGNDTLNGEAANDVLVGGTGSDVFVFARGGGDDTVRDFGVGDRVDISDFVGAGLNPTLQDSAAGTMVSFVGGDSIFLQGAHLTTLHVTVDGYLF